MDQQGIYTAPGLSREWGSVAHFAPRDFRARAGSAPPLQSYTADALMRLFYAVTERGGNWEAV